MTEIYILIGLGLVVCGLIIRSATKKSRKGKKSTPPPLPPRVSVGIPSSSFAQNQAQSSRLPLAQPLPPRRSSAPAIVGATRSMAGANCGPRGVQPAQFPCCPYDKQRNVPGCPQVIFWDSGANCYRCSRGHRFKSNGKLM